MNKHEELRTRVLKGKSDASINFRDLRQLLLWLGFEERVRGSHHIFRKEGARELVNLQGQETRLKFIKCGRCGKSSSAMA